LYARFEKELKLRWGQVGEQLGVMYDIKSGVVSSLTKIVPILKLFFSYFTTYFIPI